MIEIKVYHDAVDCLGDGMGADFVLKYDHDNAISKKDAVIDSLQLRLESQIENVNFYKNNYDETDRIILDKNDEIERLKSALDVAINVLHVVSSMHPQGNPEPKIELAKKAIERIEDILSV